MTIQDDAENLVPAHKRYMVDLHVEIPMGTAPEDKRAIFEDFKAYLTVPLRVTGWFSGLHYSDFFTVAPGVQCFRFIVSAEDESAALLVFQSAALYVLPLGKTYEIFARDY